MARMLSTSHVYHPSNCRACVEHQKFPSAADLRITDPPAAPPLTSMNSLRRARWKAHLTSTPYRSIPLQRRNAHHPAPSEPQDIPSTKPRNLTTTLKSAIHLTGPISVAAYMRQCLTSDLGGYYSSSTLPNGIIGSDGDFVTSPELTSVFGELLGIWFVAVWMTQARPNKIDFVELGPGKGTLINDVLGTVARFPLGNSVERAWLVEASPTLRRVQAEVLTRGIEEIGDGVWEGVSRQLPNVKVRWVEDLRFVERTAATPFVLAHEFFDALPIHVFQAGRRKDDKGGRDASHEWREMLVSPTRPGSGDEFELTLSKTATPHSSYLPTTSERYTALRNTPGATIEVSPESQRIVGDLAAWIGKAGAGAALIVDYGPDDTIPCNSLRGIRNHKMVSPFRDPGTTDISADVDFLALAETAKKGGKVNVLGPVTQARFLLEMGLRERVEQVLRMGDPDRKVEKACKRLVDLGPNGMGKLYKFMAIMPQSERQSMVGFGGEL
ncbi:DUF185-domain-containing protein [Piedraia hortae CBS 480.64]|uniref:Protein arginine methyltransferase NDUFAF7 n=1 Tax=Piedraia hortae CBS 480.64 TaxID=1314780 RepID=A0A6A7C879_9PEZI|nr:DUF185-domain-containing protein [Piedraia hortae CBS 480.64]